MKFDYEKSLKIEVLKEFSWGVMADLTRYMMKNKIDLNTPNSRFLNCLDEQFTCMLNLNLFEMSYEELEDVRKYWQAMDSYLEKITTTKKEG